MKIDLRVFGITAGIIALLVFVILGFSTRQQIGIGQGENEQAIEERLKGMTTARSAAGFGRAR